MVRRQKIEPSGIHSLWMTKSLMYEHEERGLLHEQTCSEQAKEIHKKSLCPCKIIRTPYHASSGTWSFALRSHRRHRDGRRPRPAGRRTTSSRHRRPRRDRLQPPSSVHLHRWRGDGGGRAAAIVRVASDVGRGRVGSCFDALAVIRRATVGGEIASAKKEYTETASGYCTYKRLNGAQLQ